MNSALDFSTETMLQPVLTQINRLDISRQTTNLTKSKDSALGVILVRGSVREIQGGGGGGAVRFKTIPFRFTFLSYFVQRFNSTVICVQLHVLLLYEEDAGGWGTPDMKWVGMLIVSLRGVNFGLWSHLGCSGQDTIIFSREGLVEGCTRKHLKIHI